jgi:hypothetical protein
MCGKLNEQATKEKTLRLCAFATLREAFFPNPKPYTLDLFL